MGCNAQAMRTNYVSRSPTKDEESFLRRALASPTHSSHSTPLPESLHIPSPVGRLLGVDGRTSTITVWLVLVDWGYHRGGGRTCMHYRHVTVVQPR